MDDILDLSIIIPVYNCEKYLKRCLNSICNQTVSNFEVIIIDDGSTDKSLSICKEYANKDSRFKVFSIANHGSAYARNYGLEHVHGKYVGFVDADDYISAEMYSLLLQAGNNDNADIVSCDIVRVLKNGSQIKITNMLDGGKYDRTSIVLKLFPILICSPRLETETPYTMVLKIFKKSFLEKNSIKFDNALIAGQDFVFSTTAFYYAESFVYLKGEYCYYYFQNDVSRTHRYLPNAWEVYLNTNKYWKKLTANCSEYDFKEQIQLDKFHGILMSLNYIFKPGNTLGRKEKISYAVDLMQKEINQSVFKLLNYKNMRNKQRIASILLKHKFYRTFAYLLYLYYI